LVLIKIIMLTAEAPTEAIDEQAMEINAVVEQPTQMQQDSEDEILTEPDLELFVVGERPVINNSRSATINPIPNSLRNRMGLDTFQYAQRPFTKLLKALPQEGIS
jgi:hypothetical protein